MFGLNVGLTEKFESNSQPMRIHISEPCKQLLTPQYKCEERDNPEIREKVGGHVSYFLTSKDGRLPLRPEVIRALLPTASERPSVGGGKKTENKEEKISDLIKKEDEKKDEDAPKDGSPVSDAETEKAVEPSPSASPNDTSDPDGGKKAPAFEPGSSVPTATTESSVSAEKEPANKGEALVVESAEEV